MIKFFFFNFESLKVYFAMKLLTYAKNMRKKDFVLPNIIAIKELLLYATINRFLC